jgi:hypothetical protein
MKQLLFVQSSSLTHQRKLDSYMNYLLNVKSKGVDETRNMCHFPELKKVEDGFKVKCAAETFFKAMPSLK